MIYVLPIFKASPYVGVCVDTTSGAGRFSELSPFILGRIHISDQGICSENFENLWQFSKVYPEYADAQGNPLPSWYEWRDKGFADKRAHRYPVGKGKIPLYSYWNGEKLDYIDARKQIYATIYGRCVLQTKAFKQLSDLHSELLEQERNLILLDYDAYDHQKLGMSLVDVINEPKRKMGHAFVLMMLLTGELEKCITSNRE